MNKVSNSVKYIDLSLISQKILFFLSSFLLIFILLTVSAPKAGAANFNGSDFIASELNTQVLNHQLYYFLTSCFAQRNMDKVTVNDDKNEISNWQWLNEEGPSAFRGDMYKNSLARCDGGYLEEAFGRFDLASNPLDTFCRLGFTYNKKTGGNGDGGSTEDCKRGVNQDDFDGSGSQENQRDDVESLLSSTSSGKAAKASLSDEAEYIRYFRTFTNGCQASPVEPYSGGAANNSTAYKITRVDKDGNAEEWYYSSKITDGTKMNLVATRTTSELTVDKGKKITCGQLATALHASSPFPKAYVKWIGSQETPPEGAATTSQDDPNAVVGTDTSCDITGVGWIVCPAMNFLGTLNDSAFGYLESLLEVRPALIQDAATNKAWSAFRDVANVAFVIAFIIIIYSQISGVGVSNYGIKKLIPKLIAAAILVNTSFIITTLMIDLSNIVGSSIYSLLGSSIDIGTGSPGGDNTWTNVMGNVLVGGAVILLVVAIIIAPVVLLALAMILLILVARQALVIMLVVVAPLAFVAFLLPNTESWFQKWWKAFTVVLMVYPVIGLVFGASTLASTILLGVAENGNGDDSQLLAIVALGVLAIPLFAVPLILKGALGAAGSIGGKLAGIQDKVNRGASGRIKGQVGDIRKDVGNRWNLAANNTDSKLGRSKFGSFSRYKTRRDSLRGTRQNEAERAQKSYFASQLTETDENGNITARALRMQTAAAGGAGASKGAVTRVKAAAKAAQSKEMFESIDNIERTLDYGVASNNDKLRELFEAASEAGNTEEMVAYSRRMGKNGSPGVDMMRDTLTSYSDKIAAKKSDPDTRMKAEAEEIDMKELLGASDGFAQTGRSFEVWSNNEQPGATFGQISSDPGTYGSISGKRFAGMSTSEQNHALKLVEANDPQVAQRLAQRVYQDETAFGQVKDTPQQTILRLVNQSPQPPQPGPTTP
jgi:hypothetical protein